MILALAGGVGGAKLANGLIRCLEPEELVVAVNTGDDFQHLGLHVSPDLDSVMYRLAGINDTERGWGLAEETWRFMAALERLGGETWFNFGDQDLATHIERTRRMHMGEKLSAITADFCRRLGITHCVVPMSDQPVRTLVQTDDGTIPFQDYFVRLRCEPVVSGFTFAGADIASPSPAFAAALDAGHLSAIVICPSNPFVSIAPILALPEVAAAISSRRAPVVAVSPIIGGKAVKGPAAKMMREMNIEPSAKAVAAHYGQYLDGLVIDSEDASLAPDIDALGIATLVTRTLMRSNDDERRLAAETLAFADTLRTIWS